MRGILRLVMSDNPPKRETDAGDRQEAPFDPDPEVLTQRLGTLDVIELVGRGAMGFVYKAKQTNLNRIVALKILSPALSRKTISAKRFEREARAMAKLHHPNIVAIHDSGRVDDLLYFVMEFVDGRNLRQICGAGTPPAKQALDIMQQLCDGVSYAHEHGIVHRDLKPSNIMIDAAGQAKIADFGVAKLLQSDETLKLRTSPEAVLGTMHYMAPEQAEHAASVDHRVDIYGLGVILYEMLTGALPLGRFALPSEKRQLDDRLDAVVLRALEKEPDRRYQDASELREDLHEIASSYRIAGKGKSLTLAYLCWLPGLVMVSGIHRFYLGRWKTGLAWLLTLGLLGIGQLVDLLLIPKMVRKAATGLSNEELELHATVFRGFSHDDFVELVQAGRWADAAPGTILATEGQRPRVTLIYRGSARIEVDGHEVAQVGAGRFIGEMSYIGGAPASATAVVLQPSRCLSWSTADLHRLANRRPHIAHALATQIGVDMSKKLAAQSRDPNTRDTPRA